MTSCRELDSTRSALSAASAFAIATAGANEGTPTKEKYRRMSLASAGTLTRAAESVGTPFRGARFHRTWLRVPGQGGCPRSTEPPQRLRL